MRSLVRSVSLAAVAGLTLAGCNGSSSTPGGNPAARAITETAPMPKSLPLAPPATGGKVELTDVTFAGLNAAVEQNRGKVVLVDVWETTCAPCKKKFPHLVQL